MYINLKIISEIINHCLSFLSSYLVSALASSGLAFTTPTLAGLNTLSPMIYPTYPQKATFPTVYLGSSTSKRASIEFGSNFVPTGFN